MTRRVVLLSLIVTAAGCASQSNTARDKAIDARLAAIQDAQGTSERRLADLEARLAVIVDQQAQMDDMRRAMDELRTDMRHLRDDLEAAIAANKPIGPPVAAPVPRPATPDPDKVYAVAIDGDPVRGKKTAKVTIVEVGEFACPFCIRVRATRDQIEKDYGDDVRIVFKNYVVHPQTATDAGLAACAAHLQGKFWEMEAAIVDHAWDTSGSYPKLKDAKLLEKNDMLALAKDLKLDEEQFKKDMESQTCKDDLSNDQKAVSAVGTRGTPTFYINGRYISGAQPIDVFKKVIDEELAKATTAIKAGTKAEKYYQRTVVDGGLKSVVP